MSGEQPASPEPPAPETATADSPARPPPSAPPAPPASATLDHRSRECRGRKFGWPVLLLAVAAATGLAGSAGYLLATRAHGAGAAADASKPLYQCPMHPSIVRDRPGNCPICGMKLVKIGDSSGTSAEDSKKRKIEFYRSPMDPRQTSPVPRKDEMGMDFIPVYEDEKGASVSSVEGLATIEIDPARQQLIGLKTADVTRGKVTGAWRTVGRVAVDERRVRRINIKVPVYVERVYVDFIGKSVRRGAALFSGYSPELLLAQEEYRIALATRRPVSASSELPAQSNGLVAAARRKLELLDVPDSTIKKLERNGKARKSVTFHSPITGVVTKKDVVEGTKLDEGALPYEIVDLSRVWVLADIYETDLHRVRIGMPAKLTLKAYPNRLFEGTSAFVDPVLDPNTRTAKLRLEFANPSGELRPEMFGEVTLESGDREGLLVPQDAVVDSGTMKVVFVAVGEGKFQPREVSLGDSAGRSVEVLSGLSEGERVVVRANFLIDSESRLRASLSALTAGGKKTSPAPPPSPSAPAAALGNDAAPKPNGAPSASGSATPAPLYVCPMHPEVTDSKPSRCPKCGMVLVPKGRKGD